jgi:tRNA-Thr(GGU) m(6)t(6)A37 methyltransferase TsaA
LAPITLVPIGVVRTAVDEVIDDIFGGVVARVELNPARFLPDSLKALDQFSHIEVLFVLDRIAEQSIEYGARRPRGRADWPEVGVFAQRTKNRPNRIGATVCRLVSVRGLSVEVEDLDAVDGTPVLDIKPYLREFGPRGEVRQPDWATELMSGYWRPAR